MALALTLGADGVHLSDPAGVGVGRARIGPDRILGASCGGSRHAAMLAGEDGADYIAFGEPGSMPSLLELAAWWSGLFVLPCLAEGARDVASVAPLVQARADFVGVSGAVWTIRAVLAGAGKSKKRSPAHERRPAETTS